jgi:hypothetical protein
VSDRRKEAARVYDAERTHRHIRKGGPLDKEWPATMSTIRRYIFALEARAAEPSLSEPTDEELAARYQAVTDASAKGYFTPWANAMQELAVALEQRHAAALDRVKEKNEQIERLTEERNAAIKINCNRRRDKRIARDKLKGGT